MESDQDKLLNFVRYARFTSGTEKHLHYNDLIPYEAVVR